MPLMKKVTYQRHRDFFQRFWFGRGQWQVLALAHY